MKASRKDELATAALGFLQVLYNAAYRMTGNEHDAEDLTQDAYTEAFAHADQLRNIAHCKAWLFRILRTCLLTRERRRGTRPELVLLEGGVEAAETTTAPEALHRLERNLLARLSRPAIARALAGIPEELRTAVLLCDLEGFTYEEIAEIMACPVGTVRSRIARARIRLANQLAAQAAALGIVKDSRS
jgi:RNA polymerase sigma-70 factor (ECF subfamily)